MTNIFIWIGIIFCLSQCAMFSGINLALFSVGRLRLEVEAASGNPNAVRVLALRTKANFSLATILWGNVAFNVLLAQLSASVLTGILAFVFSTIIITVFGEIIPQAYFSRHALKIAARLFPMIRIYQVVLFPLAWPSAWLLNAWLGPEGPLFFRERDFRPLLLKHVNAPAAGIGDIEARGALNFFDLDDLAVRDEGEPVDPRSIVTLPLASGRPVLPPFEHSPTDPFLRQINASGMKWVIIVDESGKPAFAVDAHRFLRAAIFNPAHFRPETFWHRPIIVTQGRVTLGEVLGQLQIRPRSNSDNVIGQDLILFWGAQKRIISGSDLLGRLLHGIAGAEAIS